MSPWLKIALREIIIFEIFLETFNNNIGKCGGTSHWRKYNHVLDMDQEVACEWME